ncbi:hypothetical protein BGP77_11510 [Saccharospirillum sp. MSK14-1]|nr:hypothetical protein BGP77_11510 [Saccharospirillum sp. MSK14-1]
MCGGLQLINPDAETEYDLMFNDHDALRIAIKYLQAKDQIINQLSQKVEILSNRINKLQPLIDQQIASELQEAVYPKELTRERAKFGQGGYGD